jgi:hypothetical protein
MKSYQVTSLKYIPVYLASSVALIFALATPVLAQRGMLPESEAQREERQIAQRAWELRNIGKLVRKDVNVEPPRVTLAQIKKDYEGMQMANNELLAMLQAGAFDYSLIADASSKIKKRAGRLRFGLKLPEAGKEEKRAKEEQNEMDRNSLKASLLSLDALILRFVSNPIFKATEQIVDVENSAKARDDLDDIIELSSRIRKSAERLSKAQYASQ